VIEFGPTCDYIQVWNAYPQKDNQVDIYLRDYGGSPPAQKDSETGFWNPFDSPTKPQEPLRYIRKEVIVGERYEILKGEEVVPNFIGPFQKELYKFENELDEKMDAFFTKIYTDIISKST